MKFTLTPEPPFDFALTAGFFSTDDDQIRKYEDGKYWQVINVNDKLILTIILSQGTIDKPKLVVELKSNKKLISADKSKTSDIIKLIFN